MANRLATNLGDYLAVLHFRRKFAHRHWEAEAGINWNGLGDPATKAQVELAIESSGGMCLPTRVLPALDPGDVLVLSDGIFWIDKKWDLLAL